MPRGPSIAKILDTRNLKAVRLKFDVRAEHKIYQEPPPIYGKQLRAVVPPTVKRRDDDLPMTSWMD